MNNIKPRVALVLSSAVLGFLTLTMVLPLAASQSRLSKANQIIPQASVVSEKTDLLMAQARPWAHKIFFLNTQTNAQGFLSVAHGINQTSSRDGYTIYGIVVSIQHRNGNWHTLEFSHEVDNRFWWNDRYIQGVMRSPNFYNRPVRITIFTVVRVA